MKSCKEIQFLYNHPLLFTAFLCTFLTACEKEDVSSPILISAEIHHATDYARCNGSIMLSVSGGLPPYTYLWSTGDTTRDLTGISAGLYHVAVTDKQLNSASDMFEILQPQPVEMVIIFTVMHPSETGMDDGKIETVVEGGYPPFSYQWSTGATTASIEGLDAKTYHLKITDSKGQEKTDSTMLTDCVLDFDGNIYSIKKIGE